LEPPLFLRSFSTADRLAHGLKASALYVLLD
jgi:hypothetical protein